MWIHETAFLLDKPMYAPVSCLLYVSFTTHFTKSCKTCRTTMLRLQVHIQNICKYIMIYSHPQNLAEKVQLISIDHYSGTGIYQIISFIGGYSCYINGIHQLEVPYANAGISSGVTIVVHHAICSRPLLDSWLNDHFGWFHHGLSHLRLSLLRPVPVLAVHLLLDHCLRFWTRGRGDFSTWEHLWGIPMFCLLKKLRVPIGFSCNTSLPILEGEGEKQSMTGTPISQWLSWLLSSEVFKAAPPNGWDRVDWNAPWEMSLHQIQQEHQVSNRPWLLELLIKLWLVVDLPLWKIWVRQLGLFFPIWWGSHKTHVPPTSDIFIQETWICIKDAPKIRHLRNHSQYIPPSTHRHHAVELRPQRVWHSLPRPGPGEGLGKTESWV